MNRLEQRQSSHILYSWSAQTQTQGLSISKGQGAVYWDHDGEEWLDFESQVFNCNAGHGEQHIIDAIKQQVDELACAHPAALFDRKAALGEALAAVTPGDLNHFFLCLSGAEANENALKIAQLVTGRRKVIARRRSYHGATLGALSLTGDNRRLPFEPLLGNVVRAEDPFCYQCPFHLTHPECGIRCAEHLEDLIKFEGEDQVAAIFLESVTGAAGGFIPPPEYWPRVREICNKYGVLLVSDEVLMGFGRTGRWFGVDHWDVVPDMMTMAKGLTSGYAPMGAVAMTEKLARHFDDETLWCGLTCYAHPLSCAAALASIEVYRDKKLVENSATLGQSLSQQLSTLKNEHSVIGDVRNLGLFGLVEFKPEAARLFNQAMKPTLAARNLHILVKENRIFVAPPLCITQEQLSQGMSRIGSALTEVFAS
ncbi:MAG TPA: aminotransferase class III-fold pyridoxal phosphate-dependent enzyme [Myxococcales bacterium]|nr:aminotransferase class III-fold pyridoxal phosphate-dependent enzyme [Myxococcales bacterium]HIN85188.1 aminotransferase class III-fold pyridoxal phosphate-dependent enzyme [Myxococcales bacterium]